MKDATYELGKHRVYTCRACGAKSCRPLQAADTNFRPFPKPCDRCSTDLQDSGFEVVDSILYWQSIQQGRQ